MEHLISPAWFEPLPQMALIAIVAVAMYLLMLGADWLVGGASSLAVKLGISPIIVGATIVSLGTTSPEMAVSVMAAWSGRPGLALGNAVGSVIADTGLIFGVGCLLGTLPADRFILNRQGWVQFGSALLLAVVCYAKWIAYGAEAAIGRVFGLVLVVLLVAYLYISVVWSRQHRKANPLAAQQGDADEADEGVPSAEAARRQSVWSMLGWMGMGLLLVLVFSHVLIVCVEILAHRWGVPQVVIASTLVALGTSLPELVIGITAVRRGHPGLLVGNVIGADILNILFVIGAAAVAAPLPLIEHGTRIPAMFLLVQVPTMIVMLAIFRIFIFQAVRDGHFKQWYGYPLVGMYFTFVAVSYLLA